MTSMEKLSALAIMMARELGTKSEMKDITDIRFPKDGRLLVYHDGYVRQIPKFMLEELNKL